MTYLSYQIHVKYCYKFYFIYFIVVREEINCDVPKLAISLDSRFMLECAYWKSSTPFVNARQIKNFT